MSNNGSGYTAMSNIAWAGNFSLTSDKGVNLIRDTAVTFDVPAMERGAGIDVYGGARAVRAAPLSNPFDSYSWGDSRVSTLTFRAAVPGSDAVGLNYLFVPVTLRTTYPLSSSSSSNCQYGE